MNPYIIDILSQPDALRKAINEFASTPLSAISTRIENGEIDRIVITGMGASYNAAYPAYIQLSKLPIPILHINAAELVHYVGGLIGPHTLLWVNSQSGRSAELLHLLERIKLTLPACLLACVNDESSPLASASDICLPIHAGTETAVSTKTYVNTLAVNLLAAYYLAGKDIELLKKEMLIIADAIEIYLADWQIHVNELNTLLGEFENLIVLGRGSSMSAVWSGALTNKEAAKFSLEGMNAAEFRHGPLELAMPGFCAMIFAGSTTTASLNHKLAMDIVEHDGRAIWLGTTLDPELPTFRILTSDDLISPLVEILPMQILTLVLAKRNNVTAGQFRIIGKVTTVE
jgi:glucosamine--fructose-6-phosphate aminotransferase (isomerizing)